MNLILTLIAVLGITYGATKLGKKMKIPYVVALILSGLIWSTPSLRGMIDETSLHIIFNLGDAALITLMFLAGLEISSRTFRRETTEAVFVSVSALVTSFIFGFIGMRAMGFPMMTSMIAGVSLGITAEATTAELLLELKKIKSKIAALMMEAGIFDDLLGLALFIIITIVFHTFNIKEDLMVTLSIAAFFMGILLQKPIKKIKIMEHLLEKILPIFVIPFFFVSMGIHFELQSLIINPLLLIVVLVLAIAGKMIGTFLIKPFTTLRWKQLYVVGWAMNSRGAIGLAIALIAYKGKMIPIEIYSALVLMALITTLIFPLFVTKIVKKDKMVMR